MLAPRLELDLDVDARVPGLEVVGGGGDDVRPGLLGVGLQPDRDGLGCLFRRAAGRGGREDREGCACCDSGDDAYSRGRSPKRRRGTASARPGARVTCREAVGPPKIGLDHLVTGWRVAQSCPSCQDQLLDQPGRRNGVMPSETAIQRVGADRASMRRKMKWYRSAVTATAHLARADPVRVPAELRHDAVAVAAIDRPDVLHDLS